MLVIDSEVVLAEVSEEALVEVGVGEEEESVVVLVVMVLEEVEVVIVVSVVVVVVGLELVVSEVDMLVWVVVMEDEVGETGSAP